MLPVFNRLTSAQERPNPPPHPPPPPPPPARKCRSRRGPANAQCFKVAARHAAWEFDGSPVQWHRHRSHSLDDSRAGRSLPAPPVANGRSDSPASSSTPTFNGHGRVLPRGNLHAICARSQITGPLAARSLPRKGRGRVVVRCFYTHWIPNESPYLFIESVDARYTLRTATVTSRASDSALPTGSFG